MFESLKDIIKSIIKSRLFVLSIVMIGLSGLLLQRIFMLQIVNGQEYVDKYTLTAKKERQTSGARGNIFDRNKVLLAYNKLSYSVTIEDSGIYANTTEKNKALNQEIHEIIQMIEGNGDSIINEFPIALDGQGKYGFLLEDTSLKRFLADVYGRKTIKDLKDNSKLKYHEAEATPEQVMEYLRSSERFDIKIKGIDEPEDSAKEDKNIYFSKEDAYKILVIRYAMFQNNYQRYVMATIAKDVSDKTVVMIKENSDRLEGVDIIDDTTRVYVNSKYFSHIIGYTGKISQEEYEEYSQENEDYELTDIIGKAGIEQKMENQLRGTKGKETFYVDNVGRIVEYTEKIDASSGNDLYLSLDSDLQIAVYDLLERQIAGILYSNIRDIKEYKAGVNSSASDIKIPIDDVYFALIDNNVIDMNAFGKEGASDIEQTVYQTFLMRQSSVLNEVLEQLNSPDPLNYEDLDEEIQIYLSYILDMLTEQGIFDRNAVDTEDEVYKQWKNDKTSLAAYLRYGISKDWIDISGFETESKYSDSTEIYEALVNYIQEELKTDQGFSKKIYKYMIHDDQIDGRQLCLILAEQGVVSQDDEDTANLKNGTISAYTFIKEKIKNLEITPAQLALDPCTGSSVVINPQTGELLACVSYPGYDTNRLANTVDTEYYNSLRTDSSLPLYNNATQQKTAPGSTFKPVTAAAGLTEEGIINTETRIQDKGVFEFGQDKYKCWIYPQGTTHANVNVTEAIRDSCNFFFYTVGFNMSQVEGSYKEEKGISILRKYAEMFGLGETTGIEIPESEPKISDEYPITSAIGQGNHNYTTTELARYTTAIANRGTVYNLTLLDKITDSEGNLIESYRPSIKSTIDVVTDTSWDAIQNGMRMVVEEHDAFDGFSEESGAAGKTGTAQQIKTRPNHALFIGYAPFDRPTLAIATRIAYGYTSTHAAAVSRNIMDYYLNHADKEELLNGQANIIDSSGNGLAD